MAMKEFYRSPNGDRWLLRRDARAATCSSGTKPTRPRVVSVSEIEIGNFLSRSPRHPQHDALLRLIGTLVENGVEPS